MSTALTHSLLGGVPLAVTLVFFIMFFSTYQGVRDADRVIFTDPGLSAEIAKYEKQLGEISSKKEYDALRLRPHPYEFTMYYDV